MHSMRQIAKHVHQRVYTCSNSADLRVTMPYVTLLLACYSASSDLENIAPNRKSSKCRDYQCDYRARSMQPPAASTQQLCAKVDMPVALYKI